MKKRPADVTRTARALVRKIEEIRWSNPELAELLEEWIDRLLAGEPFAAMEAEMDALRAALGLPGRTIH